MIGMRVGARVAAMTAVLAVTAAWGAAGSSTPTQAEILFERALLPIGSPSSLYAVRPDGRGLRKVIGDATMADASRDGTRIVFVRGDAVWVAARDGSGATKVTTPPHGSWDGWPAWLPGARTILFTRNLTAAQGKASDLWTIRVDGTGSNRLLPVPPGGRPCRKSARPSPDGTAVAYVDCSGRSDRIVVVTHPGGSPLRGAIVSPSRSLTYLHRPSWSPDGRRLAYSAFDDAAFRGDCSAGITGVYVASAAGGKARRILAPDSGDYAAFPAWSPDGKRIAYSAVDAGMGCTIFLGSIAVADADGRNQRLVTHSPGDDSSPVWLPG